MSNEINHNQYGKMLCYIVSEIKSTRVTLAHRVNSAMMQMYWNIGKRLSVETTIGGKISKGIWQQCGKTSFCRPTTRISRYNRFLTAEFVGYEKVLRILCACRRKTATTCRSFAMETQFAYYEQCCFDRRGKILCGNNTRE